MIFESQELVSAIWRTLNTFEYIQFETVSEKKNYFAIKLAKNVIVNYNEKHQQALEKGDEGSAEVVKLSAEYLPTSKTSPFRSPQSVTTPTGEYLFAFATWPGSWIPEIL